MIVETAVSGIFGSVLGGIFRLAPEVLKFFDRKNERSHELEMFKYQTELEKQRGEFRVEEKYVDFSVSQMNAIQAAYEAEGKIASKSYKWVSAIVALVRPAITYTVFGMYVVLKGIFVTTGLMTNEDYLGVLAANWTQDDVAILFMILTFYFVGRPIEKYQRS